MVEAEWCYLQRCQPAVDIMASVRSIWLQVHSVRHKSNLQNKQILKEGQRPSPGRLIYRAPCKIINMLIDFQLKFENGLQTAGGGRSIFAVWWFHSYHMQQNKQTNKKPNSSISLSRFYFTVFFFVLTLKELKKQTWTKGSQGQVWDRGREPADLAWCQHADNVNSGHLQQLFV